MKPAGFLCIDKPSGPTSRDVVNRIQTWVRPGKAGHAGTLDPLATGVLIVAVGAATRLISLLHEWPKKYRGTFRLGITTDTDDMTGQVLTQSEAGKSVTSTQLEAVLGGFVGSLLQTPPTYSAVHVQGQRAYELARQGQDVHLTPRPVEIYALTLVEFTPPDFTVDVVCSGGTYMRALGRDIGQQLGCGAVMTALRRTAVGSFRLEQAVAYSEMTADNWHSHLWPLTAAVGHRPTRTLTPREIEAVQHGRPIPGDPLQPLPPGREVALLDGEGHLLAIGVVSDQHRVQPRIVLAEKH